MTQRARDAPSTSHRHTARRVVLPVEGNGAFGSSAHSPLYADGASKEERGRYRAEAEAQDAVLGSIPGVEAYARSYFLFRGPLEAACAFEPSGWYTSPNLWWPDDRAWIVVTEVDGYSTYVGGGHTAIEDVLASTDVEAIEVTLDTPMDPRATGRDGGESAMSLPTGNDTGRASANLNPRAAGDKETRLDRLP